MHRASEGYQETVIYEAPLIPSLHVPMYSHTAQFAVVQGLESQVEGQKAEAPRFCSLS